MNILLRSVLLVLLILLARRSQEVEAGTCSPDACPCGVADRCCIKVKENLPSGFVLGYISDINDTTLLNILNQGNIQYTVSTGAKINISSNGTITTAISLDREMDGCFPQQIKVNGAEEYTFTIIVQVLDVNDNPPEFIYTKDTGLTVFNISVQESNVNSTLGCYNQLIAEDPDEGVNGTVSYSVLSPLSDFKIFINSQDNVCLQNLVNIDREKNKTITVIIKAQDNGIVPMSSELTLFLTVLDENDNKPMFLSPNTNPNIPENATIGTIIVTFEASDPDEGNNGKVFFELDISDPNSDFPFALNSTSGELYVNGHLDADNDPTSYDCTITAKDKGTQPRSTTITITITVTGINDNPPIVKIVANLTDSISEGFQSSATNLKYLKVTDSDVPAMAINYAFISGGKYFELEKIDIVDLLLLKPRNVSIDREKTPEIFVAIQFSDNGSPPLFNWYNTTITILDINDNPPHLSKTNFIVEENWPNGIAITQLQYFFEDPDNGNNGTMGDIEQLSDNKFITIHETGAVFGIMLDREVTDFTSIEIRLFDKGIPPLNSTITLNFTILDKNDNSPMFIGLPDHFNIFENQPIGTVVGQVHANDSDIEYNGTVRYQLDDQQTFFNISADTGVIASLISFDHENQSAYYVTIVASDMGTPSLRTDVTISINITDVNDNPPIFENTSYIFSVSHDASVNSVVGSVLAVDADSGENAIVAYNLTNKTYFEITSNGVITISQSLAAVGVSTHYFKVIAYNPNNHTMNGSASVEITTYVNTEPTSFNELLLLTGISGSFFVLLFIAIAIVGIMICLVRYYKRRCQTRDLYNQFHVAALNPKYSNM